MALRTIGSLADLANYDGGELNSLLQKALRSAIQDCKDKCTLEKPRTITLTLKLQPVSDDHGMLAAIEMGAELKQANPASGGVVVRCVDRGDGRLMFNDLSPNEPRQMTIDQREEDGEQL